MASHGKTSNFKPGLLPRSFRGRRRLKGKKRQFAPEARARIIQSVVKSAEHWYLDEQDLGLPTADNGSRRVVFEAKVGPVSSSSEVYRTCADRECVNPSHCEVENVAYREARLSGKLEEYVVMGNSKISKAQFEKDLTTPGTEEAYRRDLQRRIKSGEAVADDRHQHLTQREYLISPEWFPVEF